MYLWIGGFKIDVFEVWRFWRTSGLVVGWSANGSFRCASNILEHRSET